MFDVSVLEDMLIESSVKLLPLKMRFCLSPNVTTALSNLPRHNISLFALQKGSGVHYDEDCNHF